MNIAASKTVLAAIVLALMLPFGSRAQSSAAAEAGKPPVPMHEQMMAMHEQMEKIQRANDPQEREKLVHEHMQVCMQMMSTMGAASRGAAHGMMGQGHGAKAGDHGH